MVTRMRFRRFLFPLALYCATGAVVSYFSYHAYHGQRGIEAKREYKQRIASLRGELQHVAAEKSALERRVSLLRNQHVERDLLEERARVILNNVNKNDVVVLFGTD
jgi:cell division protein FtsB